jgi:hypothetical protein
MSKNNYLSMNQNTKGMCLEGPLMIVSTTVVGKLWDTENITQSSFALTIDAMAQQEKPVVRCI